ncbi:MAG: alpha/beta fold hydrolase [Alphaproteobacteria bacterium]|nr:MAG: alpha/beta fold hydrolase [Alphaproteobacteria bacterium]
MDIHAYVWKPEGEPKAVVQIAHGMAEHARRYESFARVLNRFGYAVYAHDQRGHGLSVNEEAVLGHLADEKGWSKAIEDIHLLNRTIAGKHPAVPIVLFGHSLGSFMAQQYMAVHGESITAATLSATNGPPSGLLGSIGMMLARYQRWKRGGRGHSPMFQKMTFDAYNKAFRPNRTAFDWLSRDEAEVDKYVTDPLCGFDCTIDTWIEVFEALQVIASKPLLTHIRKDMPLYVFNGTEDPVGEKTKGVLRLLKLYEKQNMTKVTHKFYEGGRHEMLNEINRDEVMADYIAWLHGAVG